MGVPVGTAGGGRAVEWGPSSASPSPQRAAPPGHPRHPSKVGIFLSTPFLGHGLEGVEIPPQEQWGPPNPEHPSAEGSGVGLVPLPASAGYAGALPKEILQCQGAALPRSPSGWALPLLPAGAPRATAPPKKTHLGDQLCPQPHDCSRAPQVPFLWSSKINLSPWSRPEWCSLKDLSPTQ